MSKQGIDDQHINGFQSSQRDSVKKTILLNLAGGGGILLAFWLYLLMVVAQNSLHFVINTAWVVAYTLVTVGVMAVFQASVASVAWFLKLLIVQRADGRLFRYVFLLTTPLGVLLVLFVWSIIFIGYIWSLGCGTAACY